ncbi:hypothetical protein [Providencia rettgeri]|uniref:hypothetical protein n=1 Tax=Providencia rettgeri TaxID=587 RepID=UPI003523F3C3
MHFKYKVESDFNSVLVNRRYDCFNTKKLSDFSANVNGLGKALNQFSGLSNRALRFFLKKETRSSGSEKTMMSNVVNQVKKNSITHQNSVSIIKNLHSKLIGDKEFDYSKLDSTQLKSYILELEVLKKEINEQLSGIKIEAININNSMDRETKAYIKMYNREQSSKFQSLRRDKGAFSQISDNYLSSKIKVLKDYSVILQENELKNKSESLSEQISSFSMPDEVSSVMDNAIESPTKMNSIAHHNCGGLGRTGFCLLGHLS